MIIGFIAFENFKEILFQELIYGTCVGKYVIDESYSVGTRGIKDDNPFTDYLATFRHLLTTMPVKMRGTNGAPLSLSGEAYFCRELDLQFRSTKFSTKFDLRAASARSSIPRGFVVHHTTKTPGRGSDLLPSHTHHRNIHSVVLYSVIYLLYSRRTPRVILSFLIKGAPG